jgi:cytoskeletal protein CcmA (bactofilin family)
MKKANPMAAAALPAKLIAAALIVAAGLMAGKMGLHLIPSQSRVTAFPNTRSEHGSALVPPQVSVSSAQRTVTRAQQPATRNQHPASSLQKISPDQAAAIAVNHLTQTAEGYHLRHPRHIADFTPHGVSVQARGGGPKWHWQLQSAGAESAQPENSVGLPLRGMSKEVSGETVVRYHREELVEQYLLRPKTIEQQFIIPAPLPLGREDLVITGRVSSDGAFEKAETGWRWRNEAGAVTLGTVTVFDAGGAELPATMQVTANETRIEVDGSALAMAEYPVTIDPEIGANDFRISDMGPDGSTSFGAGDAAVAYNSTNNEYLVVWKGTDDTAPLVGGESEIFGQRLNAATGAEVGANDFRISDMGPDGNGSFDAASPKVAYNSTNNEYLVVWVGDDNAAPLVDNEDEIFGQRLNAATGAEVGANDFRISDMGPDGNAAFDTFNPAVAYNSTNNEYLVVWRGEDDTAPLVDNEDEIFGQRLNAATGAEVGANDFRLSDMGPDGNIAFGALNLAVAYNSTNNEYLVVWDGEDDTAPLVLGEFEIFGQRLNAATGAEVGANDFRLSDMGPDGNTAFEARVPAVAYNSSNNEYLVVWRGDDDTAPLVNNEYEIFGQRLNAATGAEVGANDFRLSDMGPDGNTAFNATFPAVAYNSANNEYLVVWYGDDDTAPLVDGELENFGQRLNAATGAEVGANDFRLSDMGPDGNSSFDAFNSAVAYNSANNECLVVWSGDDDTAPLVDDEFEIFGQRFAFPAVVKSFVLLADENVEINGQVNSDGDIHANNDIFFNEGNKPNSLHTGNVTASDDIVIKKRNQIVGKVQGDEVENDGTVTGAITENANLAKVPLPVLAKIDHGDDDVTVKKGKTLTVDPGDYEEVKVEKKGTLNLKSGTYNLECLNLGEKAMLVLDLSSGDPIILNVDEEVIFGKNAVMKLVPSTASTNLITINTDEDDDSDEDFDDDEDDNDRIVIGEGARVFGNIIAPETMVVLGKKSRFKGAIGAENILVLNGARFVHHSSTASFPKESEVEESEVTQSEVITDYVLEQNYPNPFNPSTEISFQLPVASEVKLVIYSVTGQVVRELVNGELPAGRHTLSWNGRNRAGELMAAGVYLYRLTVERNGAAPVVMTRKLTVLK